MENENGRIDLGILFGDALRTARVIDAIERASEVDDG